MGFGISDLYSILPPGTRYRELWLPELINNHATLPSSIAGGHPLTLTGARKGSTADGVRFTGAANSNIIVANNAIQNGQQAFHITIRFKLDATFAAGAASNFYLFQKLLVNAWIRVYLNAADGLLRWEQGDGVGGTQFQLTSTTDSWAAGVWHIITVSLTNTPTQRLIVDGSVEDTDTAAAVATPGGGDMIIGNSAAAGVDGVIGVISWVVIGVGTTAATALTADEETDLSHGLPPVTAKVQYMFLLDEGRGVTAYDRGSAGGNGTIGAVCTWKFGQVQQPVISLDGINDHGQSTANVSGDISIVWVGKMKTTLGSALFIIHRLLIVYPAANNHINLYISTTGYVNIIFTGSGTTTSLHDFESHQIDDYLILIGTLIGATGVGRYFVNGTLSETASGAGPIIPPAGPVYFGRNNTALYYGVDKPLFVALIDGAFTQRQARTFSKTLNNMLGLGLTI